MRLAGKDDILMISVACSTSDKHQAHQDRCTKDSDHQTNAFKSSHVVKLCLFISSLV